MPATLAELVREELSRPVDPRVAAMAEAIARAHGEAARAVLFYGSCLRQEQLDGLMLDFYLIVSDYRAAYPSRWLAFANRHIPPNVFPFQHNGLAAKYAVLSEVDFDRLCGLEARDVSVWARFAQPSRIVWARDETATAAAVASVARAAPTLLAYATPVAAGDPWHEGFTRTYGCELRAEPPGRAISIVDQEPDRYRAFAEAVVVPVIPRAEAERAWRRFRRRGKWLSVARLAKATTTFSGGIDYIAWKINRHAGTRIEVKPWQRRWPILGGPHLAAPADPPGRDPLNGGRSRPSRFGQPPRRRARRRPGGAFAAERGHRGSRAAAVHLAVRPRHLWHLRRAVGHGQPAFQPARPVADQRAPARRPASARRARRRRRGQARIARLGRDDQPRRAADRASTPMRSRACSRPRPRTAPRCRR